jgi:hypothetical protein
MTGRNYCFENSLRGLVYGGQFNLMPEGYQPLDQVSGHRYLADNTNDLVGLAQLLGHGSLQTTSRYSLVTQERLAEAAERMRY